MIGCCPNNLDGPSPIFQYIYILLFLFLFCQLVDGNGYEFFFCLVLKLVCCADDGTYAMKKVLIQNTEQLELVREEIRVSSLFTHPNLLPLLDHAIIAVKVIS